MHRHRDTDFEGLAHFQAVATTDATIVGDVDKTKVFTLEEIVEEGLVGRLFFGFHDGRLCITTIAARDSFEEDAMHSIVFGLRHGLVVVFTVGIDLDEGGTFRTHTLANYFVAHVLLRSAGEGGEGEGSEAQEKKYFFHVVKCGKVLLSAEPIKVRRGGGENERKG